MSLADLDRLIALDRAAPKKVAVVGDTMIDEWVVGAEGGCQDGCLKLAAAEVRHTPGGAAGAARQLTHWGCETTLLGFWEPGLSACQGWLPAWTETCVNCDAVPRKTRHLSHDGKILFRADHEQRVYGSPKERECVRQMLLQALDRLRPDAVLVSDYDKGTVTDGFVRNVVGLCRALGVPCVCDLKRPPACAKGAILKCNNDYFNRHRPGVLDFHPLVRTFGPDSPDVYLSPSCAPDVPNGPPVRCENHIGAGDCFAAHLALALAYDRRLDSAAAVAHAAGRVYVQHPFGRPPWPHELRKELDPAGGKILSEMHTLAAVRAATPGRVVFTNGCFDLLGPQHLYLLQEAKKLGDVLVVGVNTDDGVRRLKGPKRPVIALGERMAMLAGLSCVDWVVPFAEDTPVEVMKALRPDVRVKGNFPDLNRAGDELVAEIRLISPMPGWSTTNTVNRINSMSNTASQEARTCENLTSDFKT